MAESTVALHGIEITHPDRVLFPGEGITKGMVAGYYAAAADRFLSHAARRPVTLKRCPGGIDACFIQRHPGESLPPTIPRVRIREASGEIDDYLWLDGPAALMSAVQMHVVEFHIWGAGIDDIERPDRLVFDLDPDTALPFAATRQAARTIRARLESLGIPSCPLLTGGKGIHVVAPLRPGPGWSEVRRFARALAEALADEKPGTFTATSRKVERTGRIFIDWMRNARSASAIAPYSLRARPGAPVACPVGWDELDGCDSARAFTIGTIARRLERPCPLETCRASGGRIGRDALAALGVSPEGESS